MIVVLSRTVFGAKPKQTILKGGADIKDRVLFLNKTLHSNSGQGTDLPNYRSVPVNVWECENVQQEVVKNECKHVHETFWWINMAQFLKQQLT